MTRALLNTLESLEAPIDIILVGLGFMGYGFLRRVQALPGMRVVLVISRDPRRAYDQLKQSGIECEITDGLDAIHANAEHGILSISSELGLIQSIRCRIVVEMTGEVSYGTRVALETFNSHKDLVTMNAELQATVGSQLKRYADIRGAQLTDVEGDQPGSLARLIEEATLYGFRTLMAGNMKRFLNRYATPDSIREWATPYGLSTKQVTSFTDGTKVALEMCLVANYFGMRVLTRGMHGYEASRLEDVLNLYKWTEVPLQGCVDYLLGNSLVPGVFVVGTHVDPEQAKYLRYLRLGAGPEYLLYQPYHLCHLEAPASVVDLALYGRVTINNSDTPVTQVVAYAKRNLRAGEVLDGIGGYCSYGLLENTERCIADGLVPIGLTYNAVILHPIEQDHPIQWEDIEIPNNDATWIYGMVTDS